MACKQWSHDEVSSVCCCRFSTTEGQRALLNVLQAYAALDAEVNYCQGMNFLAALMLTWLPREAEAFGALVLVMQDRGLRELYKADMQMLQVPVSGILATCKTSVHRACGGRACLADISEHPGVCTDKLSS